MTIFQSIKQFLASAKPIEPANVGYCPNCWGRQEYANQFFDAVHREKIDLNNIDQKKGWIEAYAARNFAGIRLQEEGEVKQCPSCKLTYE